MNTLIRMIAILFNDCPMGNGPCKPGSTGEWIGRCVKCGQAC